MGDDPESPSSRCTSPDLHGHTTAGEEQVAGDTSDCNSNNSNNNNSNNSNSSNRTVRDPSLPRLRPRALTVPKYIWKRSAGDHRPTGGPLWLRDLKKRNQRGRRGDAAVLCESDDSVVRSAADLLEGSASPSWDGFSEDLHNKSAATRHWSTAGQKEAPFVLEETLSTVPEGRESAETTMNQEEAAGPPPAAAEAARLDAIEKHQDEADEILIYMEATILPVFDSITTPRMADEFTQRVVEIIIRLGKCHAFLRRRDNANHELDLGPRIEEALAQLRQFFVRLTQLRAKEQEPSQNASCREVASQASSQNASGREVASQASSQNASC
jgi:hypothetical protein